MADSIGGRREGKEGRRREGIERACGLYVCGDSDRKEETLEGKDRHVAHWKRRHLCSSRQDGETSLYEQEPLSRQHLKGGEAEEASCLEEKTGKRIC